MTFLLCDPGWRVHKSDVQNRWDDNTTQQWIRTCGKARGRGLKNDREYSHQTVLGVVLVCLSLEEERKLKRRRANRCTMYTMHSSVPRSIIIT